MLDRAERGFLQVHRVQLLQVGQGDKLLRLEATIRPTVVLDCWVTLNALLLQERYGLWTVQFLVMIWTTGVSSTGVSFFIYTYIMIPYTLYNDTQ